MAIYKIQSRIQRGHWKACLPTNAGRHVRSPDPHPILRIQIQRIARLHAERLVPRIDVVHRPIHAELARRMRIAGDLAADGVVGADHRFQHQ